MKDIHLGSRLKTLMGSKGKSVSALSRYMGYANRQTVYDIYKRPDIPFLQLVQICEFLGISINEFVGESFDHVLDSGPADVRQLFTGINKRFAMLEDKMDLIIRRG
jgi:DNA-binding Xre family transcriptional regulator